jgi:hypothetical protein
MTTVSVEEAQAKLPELIEHLSAGEEVAPGLKTAVISGQLWAVVRAW